MFMRVHDSLCVYVYTHRETPFANTHTLSSSGSQEGASLHCHHQRSDCPT